METSRAKETCDLRTQLRSFTSHIKAPRPVSCISELRAGTCGGQSACGCDWLINGQQGKGMTSAAPALVSESHLQRRALSPYSSRARSFTRAHTRGGGGFWSRRHRDKCNCGQHSLGFHCTAEILIIALRT